MKIANLNDLFLHELKDIYDAEHQLVAALPKLANAAKDPELVEAFQNHLEQTREHVTRLETVFQELGEEPERVTCRGMKGLLDEGERLLREDAGDEVRDAALIGAAQRVEHYEIAAYGTLRVWALTAGLDRAVEQLEATLAEENAADKTLTGIAEGGVNAEAEGRDEASAEDEDAEGNARPMPPGRRSASRSKASKPARSRRTTRAKTR